MSNFIRQYGEMYASRTFFYRFLGKLYQRNTQQFQALNGLKCSKVANLG